MRIPDAERRSPFGFRPAHAAWIAAVWAIVLAAIAVFAHPTPLYFVETDLVGEYLPSAREILAGRLDLAHYAFKGPGYPLLVALFAWPLGGDVALAAKLLSPLAAALSAWLAFAIARRTAGEMAAACTLVGMLVAPVLVRYALEAGTDTPALALMLASTLLVLGEGGRRRALAAGTLAALAVLTRGNAVFLVPCALATIAASGDARLRRLGAYAAGFAVPMALWIAFAIRAGGLPHDRNYLNVAWELYGEGVPWDQFERAIGSRFHSLLDVLAFDPGRAAAHIATNLFVHRALDLRELVSPALAMLALPGLVLLVRRTSGRAWFAHAAACTLVLAFVFYNARFALYLLPVYMTCAGATLAWPWSRAWRSVPAMRFAAVVRTALVVLAAALVASGITTAALENHARLADAPHETRAGGAAIAALPGGTHGAIVARKPHVAWFSGRAFVPLPDDAPLSSLADYARERGADYVFYSPVELLQRPEFGVLADSNVALPGLEPVMWRRLDAQRFYAVYRVADRPDTAGFADAYRGALRRYEVRHHDDPTAPLFVAIQLLELGDAEGALVRLDRLVAKGREDAHVDRYRSTALLALGRLDEADQACRDAMGLEGPTVWHWSQLGDVAARGEKWTDAASFYERASALQPTNATVLERLGRCRIAEGEAVRAAAAFERALVLDPGRTELRRLAMGAWQLAGNAERMKELYEEGISLGATPRDLLGTDAPPAPSTRRRIDPARND